MFDIGYVKLHRKLNNWEWKNDPNMVALLTHLLINVNYEEKTWRGIKLLPGEFITGRSELSKNCGISEQTIRTCVKRLKSTNELTTRSTNGYTIYTLVNWGAHNTNEEKSTSKSTSKSTTDQPATNQQLTTTKEIKEIKEIKEKREGKFIPPSLSEVKNFFEEEKITCDSPESFFEYYEATGWKNIKNWKAKARQWVARKKPEQNQSHQPVQLDIQAMTTEKKFKLMYGRAWEVKNGTSGFLSSKALGELRAYELHNGKIDLSSKWEESYKKTSMNHKVSA